MAAKKWSKVTDAERALMRKMRTNGATLEEISEATGRSFTAITAAAGDIDAPTTSNIGTKRYSKEELARFTKEANLLKSRAQPARVIAETLGISVSLVGKLNKDVIKGAPEKKDARAKLGSVAYKRQQKMDRERNAIGIQNEQTVGDDGRVTWMPVAGKTFNVNGTRPDPRLMEHSKAVLRTWIADTREGRLTIAPAHTINQAALVIAEDFTIHDYEVFLSDRPQWQAVREYTQSTTEQIADMVGISASSISRYEHAKRSPEPGHRRLLHDAYCLLLERYIDKVTWTLVQQSYVNTFGLAHADVAINMDELLMWVTQGQDDPHDLDIGHITYLHEIRRLLPMPVWREPTPRNLWMSGMGPRTYTEATVSA